ncbi:hypothetical protein J3Q64DRAFT_1851476 [Phycomyces blakesleeanus]|uniref:Uncharacterized protein n=2 Tax=Phycomyces blakesleeanus TaxID=4837 RepID=A0A162TJ02_PHYB8|nr:hypothetical protein PHYBLDRAFT_149970 [Phycomyces blakesleeanus NRRL 1555(-)]OAD68972.1 hypothetical protein PHYBLDRAFT_149970 [Phycomyces blakesleeanus NRRL 1555(-)]|eukprot:XP_018287012.1 hypothetical protein PHYBLDRAFT_149970 [Phycomyces blakesleeanus NRRL 1555(-)]
MTTPYYGTKNPNESVKETEEIIFRVVDDLQIPSDDIEKSLEKDTVVNVPRLQESRIQWKIRTGITIFLILTLVIGAIIVSELIHTNEN